MGTFRPLHLSNGEIAARYLAGTSMTELAMRCRSCTTTIKAILQVQNVPLRSHRECQLLAMDERRFRQAQRRAKLDRK